MLLSVQKVTQRIPGIQEPRFIGIDPYRRFKGIGSKVV